MSDNRKMVSFTLHDARRFKFTYEYVSKFWTKDDTFTFDGNEYVLGYAKYLIEYLEMQFGEKL